MKSIIWIWPDRSSIHEHTIDEDIYWKGYRTSAEAVGMHMDVISAEALDVIYHPDREPEVLVNTKQVRSGDTIFVTKFYTYPHQVQDAWMLASTFWTLKEAGFYLPVPPDLSVTMNDKMATFLYFQKAGFRMLPTIRLTTGRDLELHNLERLLKDFSYPLIAKPSSWSSGRGFNIVHNEAELNCVLRLASAANLTMIIQPYLEAASTIIDYRVYCIDEKPHTIIARMPRQGEVVANVGLGGSLQVVEPPAELIGPATRAAEMIGLPYCCMDFLFDGQNYWFSEIELDGSISARMLVHAPMGETLKERFRAYDRAHDRWLAR